MSRGEPRPPPSQHQSSQAAPAGYGDLPSLSSACSSRQEPAPGLGAPDAEAGHSMQKENKADGRLTRLERWAADASDWKFDALAGAVGGLMSGVATCPLDVIKTKLQAQGGFAGAQAGPNSVPSQIIYRGLVGTSRVIWREEGIRGMYRGLGPIIMGYLPTWAVWFTIYNKSKKWLAQSHQNTFVINFWSSIIAGASSTLATNPIWVIKTRLMSQTPAHDRSNFSYYPKGTNTPTSRPTLSTPWQYTSTLDAARKMYTTEGILSFYSGLTPALLGLTHVAVQFPAYEYLKVKLTGRPMGVVPGESKDQSAHWLGILSASIISKMLASSATYPHEVIRTRLQTQRRPVPGPHGATANGSLPVRQAAKYRGVMQTFRTILHEEGWRAFYAGMGTNMMRAVPAATVTMCTYEFVMGQLKIARLYGLEKRGILQERLDVSGRQR